jgi:predicted ABC-type ATPase
MIDLIREYTEKGLSFAFETTLATSSFARSVPQWQRDGYSVELLFLSLPSVELALARVALRVQQGGHSIPEDVIRRRFDAGRRNLEKAYRDLVNAWVLYDSSGEVPRLLDGTPDLALSLPAMKRARKRAEEQARATNTALVQVMDG